MTIEKLLAVLQPFYREWNADNEQLYLIAVRPHTTLSVSLLENTGEATVYEPHLWRLGLSLAPSASEPVIPIADVRVDFGDPPSVGAITPCIGTTLGHVLPLILAAFDDAEIREMIR